MPKQGVHSRGKGSSGRARTQKSSKQVVRQVESEAVTITVHARAAGSTKESFTPPREGKVIDANLTSAAVENLERRGHKVAKKPKRLAKPPASPPKKQPVVAKSAPKIPKPSKTPKSSKPRHRAGFRLPRPVRNTLISAAVLLVLLVGAGVLYTYFMGGSSEASLATAVASSETAAPQPITPHKAAPNAPESMSVEMLSSPISPGSEASISVKANPDSVCTIKVVYDKTPSTDPGLIKKTADDFGTVSWTWMVGPNVPLGTWPVTVVCGYNLHTGMVEGQLEVVKA